MQAGAKIQSINSIGMIRMHHETIGLFKILEAGRFPFFDILPPWSGSVIQKDGRPTDFSEPPPLKNGRCNDWHFRYGLIL